MGSIKIAAVLSVICFLTLSMLLKVANLIPGKRGSRPSWYFIWPVADREPKVLPWKELWKLTISYLSRPCLRKHLRASLIAASTASVPELQKKTLLAKETSHNSLASLTLGSL